MAYVTEIMTIPDVNGDFPLKVTADSGHILIESAGTYLDMRGLDVLRAVLRTAEVVAAQQRSEMAEEGK